MFNVTELEMRVLSELEEAGEEALPSLINTVSEPIGDASEVFCMREALDNLVRLDLVRMSDGRRDGSGLIDLEKRESADMVQGMADWLIFDRGRGLWTDSRRAGPPFAGSGVCVTATPAGMDLAVQILNDRGYQWWRRTR